MDQGDDDPNDRPAGLPSARSNTVILIVCCSILMVPLLAIIVYVVRQSLSTTFADTIGEVAISGLGKPGDAPLALPAGTPLLFAVDTSYSFSGNPVVMLDVSLHRDGAQVAKTECNMKGFTGFGASGSNATVWYGDAGWTCTLDVPDGGMTSIRATVRKSGTGSLELSHTSVIVKRP